MTSRKAVKRAMCPFINKQIIAAADGGSVPALLSVIDENLQAMNLVNLTTALHRLAKLPPNSFCGTSGPGAVLLDQLIAATKSSLSKTLVLAQDIATPSRCQTISNIAWSAATLGCNDIELLAIVVQYVEVQLQHFEHFELSSMLWSLSTLAARNPSSGLLVAPIFNEAVSLIIKEVDQFKANFLVMIVWAFANAKIFEHRVFMAVAPAITAKMQRGQLSARQLSSLARSFSDAGYLERDLYEMIAQRSASKLHSFEEQELVDLAVGVACASITEWAFFSQVAKSALARNMSPVNLGILMHAISMVRPRHPGLAAALLALLERSPEPVQGLASVEARDAVVVAVFESVGILHDWELQQLPSAPPNLPQRMSVALPSARVLKFLDNAQSIIGGSLQMMADESLPQVLRAFVALSEDRPKVQWARLFDAIAAESARRCTTLESGLLLTLARELRQAPGTASAVVPLLLGEAFRRRPNYNQRQLQLMQEACGPALSNAAQSQRMPYPEAEGGVASGMSVGYPLAQSWRTSSGPPLPTSSSVPHLPQSQSQSQLKPQAKRDSSESLLGAAERHISTSSLETGFQTNNDSRCQEPSSCSSDESRGVAADCTYSFHNQDGRLSPGSLLLEDHRTGLAGSSSMLGPCLLEEGHMMHKDKVGRLHLGI